MNATGARARQRAARGQGEGLRDEILDAAEALLVETQSEDAVSIRAVADRVGVTPPSIYRHFADKATLMFDVCDRQFTRLEEDLSAHRRAQGDPVEAVVACGRAYVRFGLANAETYRIMFMGRSDLTPEQYHDEVLSERGPFHGLVRSVQDVADAGRLRIDDVMQAALFLWSVVHSLVSLRIAKPNFPWPPLDDQVETALSLARRALMRGEAPGDSGGAA